MTQVYRVLSRKKRKWLTPYNRFHLNLKDFVLDSGNVFDIQDLMVNKNIIPYWIDFDEKNIIFAEVSSSDQLSHASFISDSVYELADRLYFISFSNFISMTCTMKLKTNIALGAFTPRSGSTFLCKLIAQTNSVFVISEPMCLNLIERLHSLRSSFGQELFKGLILFFSNFCYLQGKTCFYLKPYALSDFCIIDNIFQIETIKIISWRGLFETLRSLNQSSLPANRSVFGTIKSRAAKANLAKIIISTKSIDQKQMCNLLFSKKNRASRISLFIIYSWYLPMLNLIKMWQKTESINSLIFCYDYMNRYSDDELIKLILNHLGCPQDFSPKMLTVFGQDSQAGTFIARDKKRVLTTQETQRLQKIAEDFTNTYAQGLESFFKDAF